MDDLARKHIDSEWQEMRKVLDPEVIIEAANRVYDEACKHGVTGWDGTTQLEKDGKINQNLND